MELVAKGICASLVPCGAVLSQGQGQAGAAIVRKAASSWRLSPSYALGKPGAA